MLQKQGEVWCDLPMVTHIGFEEKILPQKTRYRNKHNFYIFKVINNRNLKN